MADSLAARLHQLDDRIAQLRDLELRAIFAGHAEVDLIVDEIDQLRRHRVLLAESEG